jgi:hypothetical protein
VTLQIVASLIDAAKGVIYDRHMFIVQATGQDRSCAERQWQKGENAASALCGNLTNLSSRCR